MDPKYIIEILQELQTSHFIYQQVSDVFDLVYDFMAGSMNTWEGVETLPVNYKDN